jgi:hypothetical protein
MAQKPETKIVKKITDYLLSEGCMVEKRHGGGYATTGQPDIHACWQGHDIEIEVKCPGNKPTTLQLLRMEEWKRSGATVAWVTDVDQVKSIMEVLKNETVIHQISD